MAMIGLGTAATIRPGYRGYQKADGSIGYATSIPVEEGGTGKVSLPAGAKWITTDAEEEEKDRTWAWNQTHITSEEDKNLSNLGSIAMTYLTTQTGMIVVVGIVLLLMMNKGKG